MMERRDRAWGGAETGESEQRRERELPLASLTLMCDVTQAAGLFMD